MSELKVGILTVSDRCSRGEAEDKSGPNLVKLVTEEFERKSTVKTSYDCVQDDQNDIAACLTKMADEQGMRLILTTGGTGFAARDVTPEATRAVIDRLAPGLSTAMMVKSLEITPFAMLTRSVCGIRGKCLIVNLPGSLKASTECFNIVKPALQHALDLLADAPAVASTHASMGAAHVCPHRTAPAATPGHSAGHVCPHRKAATAAAAAGHGAGDVKDLERVARRARSSPYPMIPMDEAVSMVMSKAARLEQALMPIASAQGHTLALNVCARDSLPPFPASVKDGYAVIASDGTGERKVIGPVTAGDSPSMCIKSGEVARISTGACLPDGADAVVQVEDTELVEDADDGRVEVVVRINSAVQPGHDVRPVGFDIKQGETVLQAGCVLGAAELGLLASIGVSMVSVTRQPVVGVLSTGNELCDPATETLPGGHIRDSNRTMLLAAVRDAGFEAVDLGIASDNTDALTDCIRTALAKVDVLITSGGVSMGEKDLLKTVLTSTFSGVMHFGRVKMKPGKPTTFVTIPRDGGHPDNLVFALPGNPVSALVTFYLFTLPALRKMSGMTRPSLPSMPVQLSHRVELDTRPEYQRCVIDLQSGGSSGSSSLPRYPVVSTTGSQCSSRLLSMRSANGLLCLPPLTEQCTALEANSVVQALIIGSL